MTALAEPVGGLTAEGLTLTAGLELGVDLGLAAGEATGLALAVASFTGLALTGSTLLALTGATVLALATVLAFGTGFAATDGLTAVLFFCAVAAVLAAFGAALAGAFLGVVTSCLLAV